MPKLNPPHPGFSVLDSLDEVGWTITEFSDRLGISEKEVSSLLKGKLGISPAMALALECIGWSNADFWMRLQDYYDLAQERRKRSNDPISNLGENPISLDIEDASVNHDKYIYMGE